MTSKNATDPSAVQALYWDVVNGPEGHSGELTADAIGAAAELIRFANHATNDHEHITRYPSELGRMVGQVETLVMRLPQLLDQLAAETRRYATRPELYLSGQRDVPAGEAATKAATALRAAGAELRHTADLVGRIFQTVDNLGLNSPPTVDQDDEAQHAWVLDGKASPAPVED